MEALTHLSPFSIPTAAAHHPIPRRRRQPLSQPTTADSKFPISRLPILPLPPPPRPPPIHLATSHRASFSSAGAVSPSKTVSSSNGSGGDGGIRNWVVVMERPQQGEVMREKSQIVDYYVETLQKVLGDERDARSCIFDVSCDTQFSFCCDIDEEASHALSRLPGVLSVRPHVSVNSAEKNYTNARPGGNSWLFPVGESKPWLVRMKNPFAGVVTKAQMVDYYVQVLTKVLGNEKDAQMCMYHVSWQSNFGFCCILDEECAQVLAGVLGVISVVLDDNFASNNKNYGGDGEMKSVNSLDSPSTTKTTEMDRKKLFIMGLSFYTSEKTLRAAFEPFGELVQASIIMDKISKRSKGYAFIEYTTEAAASAALKEMNGKVINGWMISVDVAKSKPWYSKRSP